MKRLFLASSANLVLDAISELLPRNPAQMSVAFIPTASDTYEQKPWVDDDRTKLSVMGFQVKNVDLKGKTAVQLDQELSTDIIFVAGGNVFYLLQELQKSGAIPIIQTKVSNGVIFAGSSAGTIIAGPSIENFKELDHPEKAPELQGYTGMQLIDVIPLVHFGHEHFVDRYQHSFVQIYNTPEKCICIRDNQALLVKDDLYKLVSR